jgi:hypothetical protein
MNSRKIRYICWILLIMIVLPGLATWAGDGPPPYVGQEPPGLVPKIFAPGFVCLPNRFEFGICLSIDGRECYFSTRTANWSSGYIMVTRYENGQWSTPARAPFSNYQSGCPALADNDQSCYFSREGSIYKATRTANGWSGPTIVNSPVSSSQSDWTCHVSNLGNIWLCSWRSGGVAQCDLWRVQFENERFTQAQNLRSLNTTSSDCDPAPGPDEDYVIWMSHRPGGFGGSDLYISFADGQEGWTAPKNLGPVINTSSSEYSPFMSADYKYLFFTREDNTNSDIYWVSVKAFLPDPDGPVFNMVTGQRFGSIQAAVNYASSGQTILLSPGKYEENIVIPPKELTIRSANARDSAIVSLTSCSGDSESPVITLSPGSIIKLQGLTIRDGAVGIGCSGAQLQLNNCLITVNRGCGIEVSDESTLEMSNCVIAGNTEQGISSLPNIPSRGNPVFGRVNITNCTIVQNKQHAINGNDITVTNSILYFNGQDSQINGDNVNITFSDVQGGVEGDGNTDANPEFVELGAWVSADPDYYTLGDFHLKSAAGHCNVITSTWILDSITSPCVDAGNPAGPVGNEPAENGGIINMGAYGGTCEASRTNVP